MVYSQIVLTVIILIHITECIQNKFVFIPHHCEITDVNMTLLSSFNYKCQKRSRTQLSLDLNFSYVVDVTSDDMEQMLVTGYMFRSNEYRKGPIEFMLGICSTFTRQDLGIPSMLAKSNLKCPMIKNTHYYIQDLYLNASKMPPSIPSGDWMIELKFLYLNKYSIFTIKWYTKVEYPILP